MNKFVIETDDVTLNKYRPVNKVLSSGIKKRKGKTFCYFTSVMLVNDIFTAKMPHICYYIKRLNGKYEDSFEYEIRRSDEAPFTSIDKENLQEGTKITITGFYRNNK